MPEKIKEQCKDATTNIVLDTLEKKKQALVFVGSKRSAEKTAEDISKKVKKVTRAQELLAEKILHDLQAPTKQCVRLAACIRKGIAFHHAGLTMNQKTYIEDAFREGVVKIISCTPTLAAGLDLPAFRTVLKDLRRYTHRGLAYISVLEYLQMSGRAGRPKYDSFGESICVSGTEAEKNTLVEKFIYGEPEEIYSKLAVEPVLRTYLLSLISSMIVRTKSEIVEFFSESFWAHQFKDIARLTMQIEKILDILEKWEFIRSSKSEVSTSDFRSANDLGIEDITYKATFLGKRVAELYIDPLTAHHLIKGLRRSTEKDRAQDYCLLQLATHTLEMRPMIKAKAKIMDLVHEQIVRYEEDLLETEPSIYEPEYDDYMDSIWTAMCLYDWVNEESEEALLEKYSIRPGELRTKLTTVDWLLYSAIELSRIQKYQGAMQEMMRLRIRLEYGVKEELLALLKLKGIGRVYARKLFHNGIKDIGDVKRSDYGVLAHLIGKARAAAIKKEVGEDVTEIQIPKKTGQMGLGDFA